jgi:hypothetical protein
MTSLTPHLTLFLVAVGAVLTNRSVVRHRLQRVEGTCAACGRRLRRGVCPQCER